VAGDLALGHGDVAHGRARPAQLGGDADGEQSRPPHRLHPLFDERAVGVVAQAEAAISGPMAAARSTCVAAVVAPVMVISSVSSSDSPGPAGRVVLMHPP
jgi:hypothetical protein